MTKSHVLLLFSNAFNLLTLIIAISFLDERNMSVWLVVSNTLTLSNLMMFSSDSTITRFLGYAMKGIKSLPRGNVRYSNWRSSLPNSPLIMNLIVSKDLLSLIFSLILVIVLLPLGLILKSTYDIYFPNFMYLWIILIVTCVFCIDVFLSIATLRGLNLNRNANNIVFAMRAMIVALFGLLIFINKNIYAYIITLFSTYLVMSLICRWKIMQYKHANLTAVSKSEFSPLLSLSIVLKSSIKLGIIGISGFTALRASLYLSVALLPLKESTAYNLVITIFLSILSACLEVIRTFQTQLAAAQVDYNLHELRNIMKTIRLFGLGTFALSGLGFIIISERLFSFYSSNSWTVTKAQLLVLFVIFCLELNHTISAMYITSKNIFPMLIPSLVSGISAISLIYFFAPLLGIWGLIFSQGIVQLSYNNWKWPLLVHKELKVNF